MARAWPDYFTFRDADRPSDGTVPTAFRHRYWRGLWGFDPSVSRWNSYIRRLVWGLRKRHHHRPQFGTVNALRPLFRHVRERPSVDPARTSHRGGWSNRMGNRPTPSL